MSEAVSGEWSSEGSLSVEKDSLIFEEDSLNVLIMGRSE